MPDHLENRLRPFTTDEFDAAFACLSEGFGEDIVDVEGDRMVFEPKRTLGLWDGDRVVATSGIYSRDITIPGAVVPFAAVTLVSVAGTHRRQGVLTAMMRRQLREVHERGTEPIAALYASEATIYGRFGYGLASYQGQLKGETQQMQLRPEVDTGSGRVHPVEEKDFRSAAIPLYDAIRPETPGLLSRRNRWWDSLLTDPEKQRNGRTARRYLLHTEADGTVTGFALFRRKTDWADSGPDGTVFVTELHAAHTAARAALWQYFLSMDLVRHLSVPLAGRDDPLRHMLSDARAVGMSQGDGLYVRVVDVGTALAARRYPSTIDLILDVEDHFCPWNAGRWRLTGGPSYGRCVRTDGDPDLALSAETLGAVYLGDTSLGTLAAAGRVREITPGALAAATTAFGWPVATYSPEGF
ncbi:MAG: GNAT family N-acetyltransferase [Actinomycetota bacterium]|nr:GNAT family N-acetyltransferase [Actinomycetota bacterium]